MGQYIRAIAKFILVMIYFFFFTPEIGWYRKLHSVIYGLYISFNIVIINFGGLLLDALEKRHQVGYRFG